MGEGLFFFPFLFVSVFWVCDCAWWCARWDSEGVSEKVSILYLSGLDAEEVLVTGVGFNTLRKELVTVIGLRKGFG